jgi:protoporphyrinogen IX oxidase
MLYLWMKVFHIVGFVAWFAGMFYIWRLFVYHAETTSQDVRDTLSVMERKLYKIIMTPAMIVTLICGVTLFVLQWDVFSPTIWVWLKIFLVVILIGEHHMANFYRKKLLEGIEYSSKRFRI